MPIYEYSCKKCGQTIEVIQKMSDPELKKHQGCGGALTKLISAAGFQFKGTGWYVTDYARKSEPSSEGGAKDSKDSKDSSNNKKDAETKKSDASPSKDAGKASETKSSSESKPAKPSVKKD